MSSTATTAPHVRAAVRGSVFQMRTDWMWPLPSDRSVMFPCAKPLRMSRIKSPSDDGS